jgi:5-methylcytosine-specific restriction protein A
LLTTESNQPNTLTLEHKIPVSRGGNTAKDNVLPSCKKCNRSKGYWTLDEFVALAKKWSEAK